MALEYTTETSHLFFREICHVRKFKKSRRVLFSFSPQELFSLNGGGVSCEQCAFSNPSKRALAVHVGSVHGRVREVLGATVREELDGLEESRGAVGNHHHEEEEAGAVAFVSVND